MGQPGERRIRRDVALAAFVGALAAIALMTIAAPARAEPPSWWPELVLAGPPGWQPTRDAPPPLQLASKETGWSKFFQREILENTAEIIELRKELGLPELGKELGKAAFEAGVVAAMTAALEACPALAEAEAPLLVEETHRAAEALSGLNVLEKQSRLNEDEHYVEWLFRWYSRYNPGYKGLWDASRKWIHNPRSPFNRFNERYRKLAGRLKKPNKCSSCSRPKGRRTAAVATDCGKKPKPKPKPSPGPGGQPPSCTGTDVVDVGVNGEFTPDNVWGVGQVAATPSNGLEPVRNGYDAVGGDSFAWSCGTRVTLVATAAMGSHFVSWSSPQGLCAGASPSCSFTARTDTPGNFDNVVGNFAPTLYTLSVTNSGADSGAVVGGPSEFPPINCGNTHNGTGTYNTLCSTQVRAADRADDIRVLDVKAVQGYAIATLTGCDTIVYANSAQTQAQCQVLVGGNREISVSWKLLP